VARPLAFKRRFVDALLRRLVGVGGAGVIATIALIFLYLVWVVAPALKTPSVTEIDVIDTHPATNRRVFGVDDTYAQLDANGDLRFFRSRLASEGDARAPLAEPRFDGAPVHLGDVTDFDVYWAADRLKIVLLKDAGAVIELIEFDASDARLPLAEIARTLFAGDADQGQMQAAFEMVRVGPRGTLLYALDARGSLHLIDAKRAGGLKRTGAWPLVPESSDVSAITFLSGRYSWLVADDHGLVTQWMMRAREVLPMREFNFDARITHLAAEPWRKVALAVDEQGGVHLMHTTSGRVLAMKELDRVSDIEQIQVSPRGDRALLRSRDGQSRQLMLDNEHPEISWRSLMAKTWYEGYPQPSYTWQSAASESDFEPKFSFVPLIVGTFKAAFYAMLVAVPVAVLGAIYTAYFMAPAMRRLVKPGVEFMAAMPTVVLGFLAGLWLAPLVESHLTATLLSFIVLPISVLVLSRLAWLMPDSYARRLDPWLGLFIVPLIVLIVWLLFRFDAPLESLLFAGDAQHWFRDVLGLDYDQRNALVVGVAMGVAVVPIIFSISEDAIHGVPRHLTSGSLALGATPWQTLASLVVPFASPGIFSAVMIGFGRAVGETMIVLMATGNTPLTNMNLFEGMRTFAANIAIELPESEVGSSHFRLLFLSALLLFVVTFAFNTIAEVVRARLRKRYASL